MLQRNKRGAVGLINWKRRLQRNARDIQVNDLHKPNGQINSLITASFWDSTNRLQSLGGSALVALAVLFSSASAALGAEITKRNHSNLNCKLSVTGDLLDGDAERLKHAIERETSFSDRGRICFDSGGGSYLEGLRIAHILVDMGVGTAVPANSRCLSACALAFMGGTKEIIEGSVYHYPDRLMQPSAKIGFHAPALLISKGEYDEAAVSKAYEIAIETVAELIRLKNVAPYRFKDTLFEEMLRTPQSSFFYIQTVGQAARWSIKVETDGVYDANLEEVIRNFCEAADARIHDIDLHKYSGYSLSGYSRWDVPISYSYNDKNEVNVMIPGGFGLNEDPGQTDPCMLYFLPPTDRQPKGRWEVRLGTVGAEDFYLTELDEFLSFPPNFLISSIGKQKTQSRIRLRSKLLIAAGQTPDVAGLASEHTKEEKLRPKVRPSKSWKIFRQDPSAIHLGDEEIRGWEALKGRCIETQVPDSVYNKPLAISFEPYGLEKGRIVLSGGGKVEGISLRRQAIRSGKRPNFWGDRQEYFLDQRSDISGIRICTALMENDDYDDFMIRNLNFWVHD